MTTTDGVRSWDEKGTTDQIGWGIVGFVALIALSAYLNTRGLFNIALLRVFLLGAALIGLRLSTASSRFELAALRGEAWKRHIQMSWENDEIDRCMRRREKRQRIRMGQETDDGLSDWGRQLRGNPTTRRVQQMIKDNYPDYSHAGEYEDVFAMEEVDERLLAAWAAKVSAESDWRDALRSREGVNNSAS